MLLVLVVSRHHTAVLTSTECNKPSDDDGDGDDDDWYAQCPLVGRNPATLGGGRTKWRLVNVTGRQ